MKPPLDYILKWYDDLPKDFQEQLSSKLYFYIPETYKQSEPDRFFKSKELLREFIDTKNLHVFSYVKHVLTLKALINYYYEGQRTTDDWENRKNEYLEELSKLQDDEYNRLMLKNMPEILRERWPEHAKMRIEALKKYLNNFDKDSTTFTYYYDEWTNLCENELSNNSINQWEEKAVNASMLKR